MKMIYSGIFLGALLLAGSACNAQQTSTGLTDLDGLYQLPTETSPSMPKQRVLKGAKRETAAQRPASLNSKLTNWEEVAGRQQADDDRLKRKLNICRTCTTPN